MFFNRNILWIYLFLNVKLLIFFFVFFGIDRDVYTTLSSYRYTPRVGSPLSIDDPVQRVRQQNLISRWNDMFSQDRLDAMDTLRRYSDDYENNQRIIFLGLQVNSEALYILLFRIIVFLVQSGAILVMIVWE